MAQSHRLVCCAAVLLALAGPACSVRKMAIKKVADTLSSGNSVYASDEDLELVGEALPFGLKLMESVLAETPRHRGLLESACMGFATYAYLYVGDAANRAAEEDLAAADALRSRARRLYLRAHGYGYRALDVAAPGAAARMTTDPRGALAAIRKKSDVSLLHWNAVALGLAISVSKSDAAMLARLPEVEALAARALELDEGWQEGSLHEFQVVLAGARPGKPDFERIEKHYRRALELSGGKRAGLHVSYVEAVSLPRQDRAGFRAALERALAIDPANDPPNRLENIAAQRRARWLLDRIDEIILPTDAGTQ